MASARSGEPERRARSFRTAFFVVVTLGALPPLTSGVALWARHPWRTLCASSRPLDGAAEVAARLRWERIHDWGQWGVAVAGVLVLAYSAAWAYQVGLARGRRALLIAALVGVLLPSLGAAMVTGRALPWRLFGPLVWMGDRDQAPAALVGRSTEESGGPSWCADHPREVGRLRVGYFLHLGAGGLAIVLTFGLADLAARWRRARR